MPDIDRAAPRQHGLSQFFEEVPELVKVIIVNGGMSVAPTYVMVNNPPAVGDTITLATAFVDGMDTCTVQSVEYNPVRRSDNANPHYTVYCTF